MSEPKLKVLLINEFSQLATGFSVMGNLLLRALHPNYEVAELACYINPTEPRIEEVPWKVYAAQPMPGNEAAWQQHSANPTAQFGSDVLNEVLIDFQPDVVISWRDCWMDTFIQQTPFRNRFKWIYMPTIDGEPQRLDWLYLYRQADYINTYTQWAKNLLEKEGIKVFAAATPGPDTDLFCPPVDKRAHREKMGLNPDWFIIGSVMRNQPRKLFPEILWAFAQYIQRLEHENLHDLAAKSYLHLHTSLSDVGWDIAAEIQKYNLSHKVLLTYVDDKTGSSYLGFYKGNPGWSVVSPGHKCSFTPNTNGQLGREALADIVKCYDLYIQYSICEGLGIPLLEANACGVPAMGMPYSATAELVNEYGNIPLMIAGWRQELPSETSQRRAVGDPTSLACDIYEYAISSPQHKRMSSDAVRNLVLTKYNSGVFIDGFANLLKKIDADGFRAVWNDTPKLFRPNLTQIPNFISHEDFIIWAFANVIGRPYILTKETLDKHAQALYEGRRRYMENGAMRMAPFTRDDILRELMDVNERINNMEVWRYHKVNNIETPSQPKYRVV